MSTYRTRPEDAGGERSEEGAQMPCLYCGAITPHLTLRTLGARCKGCFDVYCANMPPRPARLGPATRAKP